MVDHKLLAYIHGRLRQIKQCHDFSPFGNVSIIAVGDFYQLSSVKGKALHTKNVLNPWANNYFLIAKQRWDRNMDHLQRFWIAWEHGDLKAYKLRMLSVKWKWNWWSMWGIHHFATNNQVDKYNVDKLHSSCSNSVSIDAEDFFRDAKSGELVKRANQDIKVFNMNRSKKNHTRCRYTCHVDKEHRWIRWVGKWCLQYCVSYITNYWCFLPFSSSCCIWQSKSRVKVVKRKMHKTIITK